MGFVRRASALPGTNPVCFAASGRYRQMIVVEVVRRVHAASRNKVQLVQNGISQAMSAVRPQSRHICYGRVVGKAEATRIPVSDWC